MALMQSAGVVKRSDSKPTGTPRPRRCYAWVEVDEATHAAFVAEAEQVQQELGLAKLGVGPWLARLGRLAVAARSRGGR